MNSADGVPLPVLVFGQSGRMAQALAAAVEVAPDLRLVGVHPARGASAWDVVDALSATPPDTVVCDFTHPTALGTLLAGASDAPRRLVTGTSGLEPPDEAALGRYAARAAVMHGRNFSMGAVMARHLIETLSLLAAYDPQWQAAVVDFHHKRKQDPESATARDWAGAWVGSDPDRTAPISAIRLGDGISEHKLIAAGTGERLEITHKLLSFDAPVAGVLAAVRFLAGRSPGLYDPLSLLSPDP